VENITKQVGIVSEFGCAALPKNEARTSRAVGTASEKTGKTNKFWGGWCVGGVPSFVTNCPCMHVSQFVKALGRELIKSLLKPGKAADAPSSLKGIRLSSSLIDARFGGLGSQEHNNLGTDGDVVA